MAEISEMKTYQVRGFSPEINLMKKINELIVEINRLNKKVKDLELKQQ